MEDNTVARLMGGVYNASELTTTLRACGPILQEQHRAYDNDPLDQRLKRECGV
jgi:hypothetical protein